MTFTNALFRLVQSIAAFFHRWFPAHTGLKGWLFIAGSAVLCVVMFIAAQVLKPRARKAIIVTITFLGGLFFVLEFYLPIKMVDGTERNALTPYLDPASDLWGILATMALGLGIFSLISLHGKNIVKQRKDWPFSLVFFGSMIVMFTVGLLHWLPVHKTVPVNIALYHVMYRGGLISLDGTVFSIIAFYIASAAYRAFRVRNPEASLLMASAFIVMLGQVYAGQWLTSWLPSTGVLSNLRVENLSDWLLTRVNAPAVRAIGFGIGVGLVATALRIWLSLERGNYFDAEL